MRICIKHSHDVFRILARPRHAFGPKQGERRHGGSATNAGLADVWIAGADLSGSGATMADATANLKGLVGEILGEGRYDLRELLGGGSMGHVYRALDRRLETNVVLKIPHRARLESPEFVQRFRQEARFLVKLTHPHVVSIIDVGEHQGVPFFVMPYVGGGSQRDRQRNEHGAIRPLAPESLSGWLREIARALDFIHSRDCIHRDVKPDNILFDSEGHPFLSDFGLSKLLRTSEEADQTRTAAGAVVGTPLYVAPELVLGERFDGRADQYSLAVAVYETLTGSNPFEGPNSSATMVNHTSKVLAPLTGRVPVVSEQTSNALLRGLEKSPENRFATCCEFAEAVLQGVVGDADRSRSRSSAVFASSVSSMGRSTESNVLDGDTDPFRIAAAGRSSIRSRTDARTSERIPVSRTAPSPSGEPRPAGRNGTPMYRATKRQPIVKARSTCPDCSRPFALQPAYAGKMATCKGCNCRVQIAPDFSEIRKLERIVAPPDADNAGRRSASSGARAAAGESDLILGQEVFGWKLSRKWAVGLAVGMIAFLMLLTMIMTQRSARLERERAKQEDALRHKTVEGE